MLRTRLMLGLMLLLIILLSMGLYFISECSELGNEAQAVTRDHDLSGRNLARMTQACATMNTAFLDRPYFPQPKLYANFTAARQKFEAALQTEKNRASPPSPDEKRLLAEIDSYWAVVRDRGESYLQPNDGTFGEAQLGSAAGQIGTTLPLLLDDLDRLVMAHENAPAASGHSSAKDINNTIRFICLLMIVALVATILAWMGLNRGLVAPLRVLTASIQQVGEGNLDQKVPVLDNYELGLLARSFNQMAEQLKQYRATASVELMRLNQTIRSTLASFPDPIFVLNSEGAVEFRNPEADQLAVQLLFSGVTRLPKKVDEKVEHVRATGQDYLPTLFREAIKFHLGGRDRYFLPRIVLLRDENRQTFGVAVILEEVTRMLLLDDVKSNLISTVSHELKTPLTSVRMALYLLFEKTVGSLNDKQMDLVATAREDADRLLRTLNDLLDLAKLERGPEQLALTQVLPAELVEGAVHDATELAHAGLPITIEIAEGLPPMKVDRQRIAYVFSNLITNAVKYSPPGAPILVGAGLGRNRAEQEGVRFFVRDRGPGISPEHQEHIFERFYRVPGTRKSGAGLGLSIAREIVIAHEGEIGVITGPEGGSEFFFVIPLLLPDAPA